MDKTDVSVFGVRDTKVCEWRDGEKGSPCKMGVKGCQIRLHWGLLAVDGAPAERNRATC